MNKKIKVISFIFYLILFICSDFAIKNIYIVTKNILKDDARIKNNIYHHDLKKNYESLGLINEKLYTNSLGFRDFSIREIDLDKKKTILLIGDSFTYGRFVNYEKTFAGLITKEFKKKNVEVLNAAVISYSPKIYLKKIEFLIKNIKLKFDEVVMFIDISDSYDDLYRYEIDDDNNVIDNLKILNKNSNKISIEKSKIFIAENFFVIYYFFNFINDLFSPDLYDKQFWIINHRVSRSNWDDNLAAEQYEGLQINNTYLDKLKKLLDENNIKLKIIIYPWPSDIYYRTKKTRHEINWENWSKKNKISFFNFFEYIDHFKNYNNEEKLKIIKKLYIKNDMHFNEEGHLVFYKNIINFLD